MSTQHVPFAFYGRYFASQEEALVFLSQHGTDYDSDTICGERFDVLGLQYLSKGGYILGFPLRPGESDERAKRLWQKRFGSEQEHVRSSFEIFSF